MNLNNDIISLDLIEGGRVIRQGDHFSIAVVPRDAKGAPVNLTGKTIEVDLLDRRGIVYETTAEFDASKEAVRFSIAENIGFGEMRMEFTATDPDDPNYRRKFPASDYDGRLQINRSGDDVGYIGVRMVTVEQLRKEQQDAQTEYEGQVDQKIEQIQTGFTNHKNEIGLVVEDVQQKAAGAVEATSKANTAAGNADDSADTANKAGQFATVEGQKASEAASDAQLAKTETIEATQEALDAAELARNSVDDEGAIYGVFWPKTSDPVLTRTNSAQGKIANVGTDGEYVKNDFDDAQIYREIGEVEDEFGNVFIRIPKFYIRKTDSSDFKSIKISKVQYGGYYLPKCFWDFEKEAELAFVLVGKHRASLSADNKLESKPGKYPLVSRNIVQFRDYARNNNADGRTGYQQHDIHVQDAMECLFLVEFATLHSQTVMSGFTNGQYSTAHIAAMGEAETNRFVLEAANASGYRVGQSIGIGTSRGGNQITDYRTIVATETLDTANVAIVFDGTPLDIQAGYYIYNTAFKTGFSRNVASSSGSPVSNTDGRWPCSYRGIESPWGDIYTWVDGMNINDHQTWVTENAEQYASNLFAEPYKKIGYVNGLANGYITNMGFDSRYPYAQLPVTTGGGSSTFYADYYYQAAGQRVAGVGGDWRGGAGAGLFVRYFSNSSGYADLSRGGRLLKKAS